MWQACTAGGAPDILVNCAGVQHTAPVVEMPAATWDLVLAVNLSAAFHLMRLALPAMARAASAASSTSPRCTAWSPR
jgi:3-hydroxybutyrate dehydrogenase